MIRKTKIFIRGWALILLACLFLPLSAQAATSSTSSSGSSGSGSSQDVKIADACEKLTGSAKTTCQNCRKDSVCLTCHPEYNFGQPLTDQQLASCKACNTTHGLSYNASNTKSCLQNNIIVKDLNLIINVLSGLVLLVVIGVLMAGGIQYAMAGKPEQTVQARKRITNGLIALFSFFFIWAFLQWLIPGGI
jgi:hypothetical protein